MIPDSILRAAEGALYGEGDYTPSSALVAAGCESSFAMHDRDEWETEMTARYLGVFYRLKYTVNGYDVVGTVEPGPNSGGMAA